MVDILTTYQGDLRCTVEHRPSGTILITDAPKDNHGKGESFSPTDMVVGALGSCMMTLMGIAAKPLALDLSGTTLLVRKEMVAQPTRRIGALHVTVTVPHSVPAEHREKLIKAAMTCPVHASLHPDLEINVTWNWA